MSLFGISSYVLVTKKGRTMVPFVRGTAFTLLFEKTSFFTLHVVAASHVTRPQRHGPLYGNNHELRVIGDRHVSCKLHLFRDDGLRYAMLPLDFKQYPVPRCDVALLRIEHEGRILAAMSNDGLAPVVPFEPDFDPLSKGEPVIAKGLDVTTEDTIADSLRMVPKSVTGTLAAKYESDDFGTTLLAASDDTVTGGMHGSPVLRASNGKCVGVLVANVTRQTVVPEKPPHMTLPTPDSVRSEEETMAHHQWRIKNMHAPQIDISSNGELMNSVPNAGFSFVPIGEFISFARRTEI